MVYRRQIGAHFENARRFAAKNGLAACRRLDGASNFKLNFNRDKKRRAIFFSALVFDRLEPLESRSVPSSRNGGSGVSGGR